MSSTSGSLLLPLRPPSAKKPSADSLQFQIHQINAQRGSFRNITEDSLREEIEARKDEDNLEEEEDERDLDVEGRATRLQKVWKSREEMIRQVE